MTVRANASFNNVRRGNLDLLLLPKETRLVYPEALARISSVRNILPPRLLPLPHTLHREAVEVNDKLPLSLIKNAAGFFSQQNSFALHASRRKNFVAQ